MFNKAFIPYRGYYSSPFVRYNRYFSQFNSIELAALSSACWFDSKGISPGSISNIIYGTSVHQKHGFWAGPWAATMMGAEHTTGHMTSQACTTGATVLYQAAANIELGLGDTTYTLVSDRVSNGPVSNWGDGAHEDWVNDNFSYDPSGKTGMLTTAERVARHYNIQRGELDDIAAIRHEQYLAFVRLHPEYIMPVCGVSNDVGIRRIDAARLSALPAAMEEGIHSVGNCTYPADGHVGILVTNQDRAREINSDISVQIVSYGLSRCELSMMPVASVAATKMALDRAGISIHDVAVINQHNAFAVNDVMFAREMGIDPRNMNLPGGPLVYGHPQAPVLSRLAIEGIVESVERGGGYVLVTGAAGGDTGAAILLKVSEFA